MKIEHVAIWVENLELMRFFYETYFQATGGPKYFNEKKGFSSYFLSFESGARIEIMHQSEISEVPNKKGQHFGLAHLAFSIGSEYKVDQQTERLRNAGYIVLSEPRRTGDGYNESVILDPEGNMIEITV